MIHIHIEGLYQPNLTNDTLKKESRPSIDSTGGMLHTIFVETNQYDNTKGI